MGTVGRLECNNVLIHYPLMKWRRARKRRRRRKNKGDEEIWRLRGETFPADRQDVADESGDHRYPRRRRQTSRWTGSMNGRLLVTYSQSTGKKRILKKKYIVNTFLLLLPLLGRIQQPSLLLPDFLFFTLASRRYRDGWKKEKNYSCPYSPWTDFNQ